MDKEWLKAKLLARGRGAQRELARALGYDPTVVNKMIKTARKISADEAVIIRALVAEWERDPIAADDTGHEQRPLEERLIVELIRMSRKIDELIEALKQKLKR